MREPMYGPGRGGRMGAGGAISGRPNQSTSSGGFGQPANMNQMAQTKPIGPGGKGPFGPPAGGYGAANNQGGRGPGMLNKGPGMFGAPEPMPGGGSTGITTDMGAPVPNKMVGPDGKGPPGAFSGSPQDARILARGGDPSLETGRFRDARIEARGGNPDLDSGRFAGNRDFGPPQAGPGGGMMSGGWGGNQMPGGFPPDHPPGMPGGSWGMGGPQMGLQGPPGGWGPSGPGAPPPHMGMPGGPMQGGPPGGFGMGGGNMPTNYMQGGAFSGRRW